MLRCNKIISIKNIQLIVALILFTFSFSKSWGQATLPVLRTGWGTTPTGWTDNQGTSPTYGSDICSGSGASAGRLDNAGENFVLFYNAAASTLTFCVKGNTGSGAFSGTFLIQESVNGSTWTAGQSIPVTTSAVSTTVNIDCNSRYIKFLFSVQSNGNIQIDNVSLTTGTCSACSSPTTTITPTTQTVCSGAVTTISVSSSATTPSYTWQASANGSSGWAAVTSNTPVGASYSGQGTATLNITAGATYYYQCLVAEGGTCTATSSTSTLVVNTMPSITTPTISNATSCEGSTNVTVKINASGSSSLNYQWQVSTGSGYSNVSGGAYSGGTTNTLTIGNSITAGTYSFQCVVTNACGSATSAVSAHTVVSVPIAPPTPSLITSCNPAVISETVVGTPPAGVTWYWASNAAAPASYTSAVSNYSATSSGTVYIRAMSDIGTCWNTTGTTNSVVVTVIKSPTITTQPTSSVICQGTIASFKVTMNSGSSSPLTYQWQENTGSGFTNISIGSPYTVSVGTSTSTLNVDNTKPVGTYTYQCVISNSCGTVTTSIINLTVTSPPTNDLCSNAISLSAGTNTVGSLNCASATSPTLTNSTDINDVWYSFTPTCTASYTVTMKFSGSTTTNDLDLYMYNTLCPTSGSATASSIGSTATETIIQTLTGGATYYFRVTDFNTTGITFTVGVNGGSCITTYTVTFNANGGTGSMSNQVASTSTSLTTNAFTNGSCTFTGWNTAANGSGTSYANNALYSFTVDVTLYAQWNCNPTHTVTFDPNGGSGSMSNQTANSNTNLTSNAFTNSGCTFVNWNDSANANGTSYANSAVYSFTADVTLYAQWNCTSGGGSAGCPYLVSAVVNACAGSCNAEGKNEIVVMNSGNYAIPVNGSNINLYYSGGTNHYFTNSFAASSGTVVSNLNTITAVSGCTNTPFVFVPSGGTIPANSNFMILNNNSCFNGDFSAYCNAGPVYVIISTDADWAPGGYFGNNNTPRYFRTDFSNVNSGCGLTTYNYNNPSTFAFNNDGASVLFNGGASPTYINGNGTCAPSIIILPIELVDFYATQDGVKNDLVWKVASENNVVQYIIEKSEDGVKFKEITRLNSIARGGESMIYTTEDNDPYNGVTYYRLNTLEDNGKINHLNIIDIDRTNQDWKSIIYQNDNYLYVEFKKSVPKNSVISLFDLSGNLIAEETIKDNQTKLNIDGFSAGIYFAKITTPYKTENFKIVISND